MIVHTPADVAEFLTESLKADANFVNAVVKPPGVPVGSSSQGTVFNVKDAIIVTVKDVNAPNCRATVHDRLTGFMKDEDFPSFILVEGSGNTLSVLLT